MNRRRLEAECLLDTMLAVSGQLELMAGGPSVREGVKADYDYEHDVMRRRAVYWPVLRNSLPALFEVFDFANPSMVVGSRNTSSTAPQALYLMNNPFVIQQSQSAANRLLSDDSLSDAERIAHAFRVILGRPPDPAESAAVMACVQDARGASPNRMPDQLRREIWAYVVQSLFGSIDFRYLR